MMIVLIVRYVGKTEQLVLQLKLQPPPLVNLVVMKCVTYTK